MTSFLTLDDLPWPAPLSLYNETREEVIRRYKKIPEVPEILEFGLIPAPGISDMDFYVLVQPGAHVAFPRLSTYTKEQKWAMMHKHFAMSDAVWRDIRMFDPWIIQIPPILHPDGPRNLDGVTQLSEEERHFASYEHIMTGWLFGGLYNIARIEGTGILRCREFLDTIKGNEYCHRELKRSGDTDLPILPHSEFFSELRKNWFSIPPEELPARMTEAMEKYKETNAILLRILAETFQKKARMMKGGFPPRTKRQRDLLKRYPRSLVMDLPEETYVYQEGRKKVVCIYRSWKSPLSRKVYGHGTYLLPLHLCATQNMYLLSEGIITDHYKRTTATDLSEIPVVDHPILRHRCSVMNRSAGDTQYVTGSKQPMMTYAAEIYGKPFTGTFRGRLGNMYDRLMENVPYSFLRFLIPQRETVIKL